MPAPTRDPPSVSARKLFKILPLSIYTVKQAFSFAPIPPTASRTRPRGPIIHTFPGYNPNRSPASSTPIRGLAGNNGDGHRLDHVANPSQCHAAAGQSIPSRALHRDTSEPGIRCAAVGNANNNIITGREQQGWERFKEPRRRRDVSPSNTEHPTRSTKQPHVPNSRNGSYHLHQGWEANSKVCTCINCRPDWPKRAPLAGLA